MPINIEVTENDAQLLVDFYLKKLKGLKEEIQAKEEEARSINAMLLQLKKISKEPLVATESARVDARYTEDWPWLMKIMFALNISDRALTTNEIIEVLTEYEPSFLFERKKVTASISSVLSLRSAPGKELVRVKQPSGDYSYKVREKHHQAFNEKQSVKAK